MYKQFEFDLARTSLKYIVKTFNIKELFIPYYLCDVIRHSLFEVNCKPLFYHIDDNFMPTLEFPKRSFILYPNYFGVCEKNVDELVKIYPNIIIDNAHAYFSNPRGLACFNAKHKFFEETKSLLWIKDESFHDEKEVQNIGIDSKRIKCFQRLDKRFRVQNQLKIDNKNFYCPFCYPFLAETEDEADKVAKEFINDGVIIYRYWNNLPKSFNEYKFYRKLVPIPLN